MRDAVELVLERDSDEALDLLGRVPRPQGDDLGPDIADIRISFDGKVPEGGDAHDRQEEGEGQRDEALAQRERDEAIDHRASRLRRTPPVLTT